MTTSEPVQHTGDRTRRARATVHARRADLLDRLCGLFLAEGFAHFTLDDLAARLRCSKSTLYTLAESKEQLAVRVVGHYFKRATESIEQRVEGLVDVRDRMRAYLEAASEELRPASRRFIADMAANPATRATYEANARAATDRVRAAVDDGVAEGVFREVDAALVGEMVGLTLSAIQRGEIAERTGLTDAEAFAALSQFLVGGLASRSSGATETRRHHSDQWEES